MGRLGVTTGQLFCACVGSPKRAEYTVFGDAINLSARLMCKAGGSEVLCDETTHQLAKRRAHFVALPPMARRTRRFCRSRRTSWLA